jgi:hypothetical protein
MEGKRTRKKPEMNPAQALALRRFHVWHCQPVAFTDCHGQLLPTDIEDEAEILIRPRRGAPATGWKARSSGNQASNTSYSMGLKL